MKILKNKRVASINGKLVFKLSPVAAGCAVFLSALGANVYAQEAPAPAPAADQQQVLDSNGKPIEKVVVTGIRRGIEAAISIKKNSNSIVEAISAEDIGKLPDATVAESISRLAGVTAQRNKNTGRASDISVRGLSPDFNGALLNGREQASSGDSRGVQFDLYPAEMLGSITIYKSPDASLAGQGIASTIDQRTVLPLDFAKRTMAASYKREMTGMHNGDNATGHGYRSSLTYIDQFANRTIGLALGAVKFTDSGAEQSQIDGWGGWTPKLTDAGAPLYNGQNVVVPGGFKSDIQKVPKKQEGVMGILQFRPNKDFMTTVDLFHSKNNDHIKLTGIEGAICGSTGSYDPSGVLSNATISNGVATSGTCSNFKGDARNHVDDVQDTLNSWGINSQLRNNGWTFTGDLSGSKVTHDSSRYETTAGQPGNATNLGSISWTGFDGKSNLSPTYTSSLNYADRSQVVLTDQDGWGGGLSGNPQAGYVAIGVTTDKVHTGRLSAKHDLDIGPISAVEFGINQTNRDKSRDQNEGNLIIPGGNFYGSAQVPGTGTMVTPIGIPVVEWDPQGSLGSVYALLPKVDQPIQTDKNWAVSEKVTTLYAMGSLDGQLMGLNYRGNFGGQYVHTNQSSLGFVTDTTKDSNGNSKCPGVAGMPCASYTLSGGTKYNDFLPSANIGFELPYDQMLRLGLAKTLSRPQMNYMRPGGGVTLGNNNGKQELTGGAGNPELQPFRAKALDLSWEKYFEVNGAKGYFSAAAFYKKLDTYVLTVPKVVDFAALGMLHNTPLPANGSTVGVLAMPTNGTGGNIHGIELSASVPFGMFTRYLDGFGLAVNHSSTLSSVNLLTTGLTVEDTGGVSTIPLPGLSRQVTNARLFYEANGFQASVAARHRSDFLGQVSDFQDNEQLTFIKGNTTVDFQLGYDFSSGMLKGVSLIGTVQNWTNTPFVRYAADPANTVENIKFGRVYGLQATYKF
jgi:iron complex outermembrane receptor protein